MPDPIKQRQPFGSFPVEKHKAKFDGLYVPEPNSGCWLWLGYLEPRGYPRLIWPRGQLAHRFSYESHVGEIPDGLTIDHKCRQTCCVNPDHLEPVTGLINTRRAADAGAYERSHCKRGHDLETHGRWNPAKTKRACQICEYNKTRRRRDGAKSGKTPAPRLHRTHCRNGHALTTENIYIHSGTGIECRTCRAARAKVDADKRKQRRTQSVDPGAY